MVPEQIYAIVNKLGAQAMGKEALAATEAGFIATGKQVLSSDKNTDAFYKTLVDRIGRTVLALRAYNTDDSTIKREPIEYGLILQKISFKMQKAQENPTWNALSEAASDPFEKMPFEMMQTFFDQWETWEVGGTVPDVQLETAFTDAVSMAAFIAGIMQVMETSMSIAYENIENLARSVRMVQSVTTTSVTTGVVHLVTDYNAETSSSLTTQTAKTDLGFLRYASMRMKLVSDQMTKMSVAFNAIGWERHTPKDMQVFELLSNFESYFDTYLQSDVFHNDITKMKGYKSVPYWQGSGTKWDWNSVSSINISNVAGNGKNVSLTNVIAVIRDIDSVGCTIDKRRTKSIYNPHDEYTNYWIKAEIGYFTDNSENCVVFMLD